MSAESGAALTDTAVRRPTTPMTKSVMEFKSENLGRTGSWGSCKLVGKRDLAVGIMDGLEELRTRSGSRRYAIRS